MAEKKELPVKSVYLVENYDLDDSESSRAFTESYRKIAEIALKRISREGLNFEPKLIVNGTDSTLEKFDPERIREIVDKASHNDALAVIGFGWSTMAAIAAKRTNELKVPFLSPTAVVKDVFNGEYSNSLGLPVWDAARGLKVLHNRLENPNLIIVQNSGNIQEVEYSNEVLSIVKDAHLLSYDDQFPVSEVLNLVKEKGDDTVVFVPGYSNLSDNLFEIGKENAKIRFVVGPQWPDEHEVLLGLENEVYCISDFSNLIRNAKEYEFFKSEFEKSGMQVPCIFFLKVYDALMTVLRILNENPNFNRDDLNQGLRNFGQHEGVLCTYQFTNGKITKPFYILKFSENKNGFELLEQIWWSGNQI